MATVERPDKYPTPEAVNAEVERRIRERQEHPTTDNANQTLEQVNQNHIETLASELEEFLKPGGSVLITDHRKQDIDFKNAAHHLIRLRIIRLTSSLIRLDIQELQEKDSYLSRSTEVFTSAPSIDSIKLNQSTKTSKNVSESQSSTTKSKKSSEDMPSQTKKF